MGSPVELVRDLWEAHATGGVSALLDVAGDDVIWQPYLAEGRILRGSAELRAAFAELANEGVTYEATLHDVEEHGNAVLATGTLRVRRPGDAEEATRCWAYHFRSGRLRRQTTYANRDEAVDTIAALRTLTETAFAIAEEGGEGGDRIVRMRGELDVATAPEFERALLRLRPPHQRVVLDLSELRFMDSTGLRILLQARRVASEGQWQLALRSVPANIRRLLELSGVDDAIPIEPAEPRVELGG
ncbi:MAG TPA: anti-sigma factor antagonist [Solirubrobacteraceae bacterium]|jgi:anti-anti-sigma factor